MSAIAKADPERQSAILVLEAWMRQMREQPDELDGTGLVVTGPEDYVTRHHFADGSYGREIELPAGSRVVGKIHRHAHVNVISRGRCLVATQFGVEELAAPLTFVSKPGTKRAVYALEDTVWTTIHVTEHTDLAQIEADVIAPSFEALMLEEIAS